MGLENKNFDNYDKSFNPEELEGKSFEFEDLDSRRSAFLKVNKINENLGHGGFGEWVVKAKVSPENSDLGTGHDVVIKKYRKVPNAFQEMERSYRNFKQLKRADLPTWDTYRINREEKMVLMTSGVRENELLITANDFFRVPEKIKSFPKIENITNVDDFIESLKTTLNKLVKSRLRISLDSPGLKIVPDGDSGNYKIDMILADLDILRDGNWENGTLMDDEQIRNFNVKTLYEWINKTIGALDFSDKEEIIDEILIGIGYFD